ncbi:hypothetical protein U9M48_002020 [Paspalum notatum var. saurae]|uniref:DUF295 domain-containing protein n=1 Tax=Paspalum notatum var. saurae TaxID=547442 RepID=A0AAQ3PPY2_PASNO
MSSVIMLTHKSTPPPAAGSGGGPAADDVEEAVYRDWSGLPLDLVALVMRGMDIPDLFRAGCVCTSWYAAYSAVRRVRIPITDAAPCLLYSSAADDPDTATLHSPSGGVGFKIRLPVPAFRSRYVIGSGHGWVVAADEAANLQALNPLTGAQVDLPPVTGLYHVEASSDDQGRPVYNVYDYESGHETPSVYGHRELRTRLYWQVQLSCSPSAGAECVVLLQHSPDSELSYARIGDDRWTLITANETVPWGVGYTSATYNKKNGLWYVLFSDFSIYTFDLSGPSPTAKTIIQKDALWDDPSTSYILLSPWGEILLVSRHIDVRIVTTPVQIPVEHAHDVIDPSMEPFTYGMQLYKVDLNDRKFVAIRSSDLRGMPCFLVSVPRLACLRRIMAQPRASPFVVYWSTRPPPPSPCGPALPRLHRRPPRPDPHHGRGSLPSVLTRRQRCDTATLHSPSGGVGFNVRLPAPAFRSRYVIGSGHGWVVAADEACNLQAFNPLTGAQVDLPPVTGLYHVETSSDDQGRLLYNLYDDELGPDTPSVYTPRELRMLLYYHVHLSCSPSAEPECVVLLEHRPVSELSYARLGDERWTQITKNETIPWNGGYISGTYNKNDGMWYILSSDGSIYAFDLSGPSPTAKAIIQKDTLWNYPTSSYIVFAPWGDMLLVSRHTEARTMTTPVQVPVEHAHDVIDQCIESYTYEMQLHKVDINDRKLVEMRSLDLREGMLPSFLNSVRRRRLCYDASTCSLDLNGPSPVACKILNSLPKSAALNKCLVQTPAGDIFQAWRLREYVNSPTPVDLPPDYLDDPEVQDAYMELRTLDPQVHKVDLHGQRVQLIESLPDYALFLGLNGSMCLPVKDFPGLKPNRVYVTDDPEEYVNVWKYNR